MGGALAICSTLPICSEEDLYNDVKKRSVPTVEKLPIPQLVLGEGPHWSSVSESLYLVDTVAAVVYRYNPATDRYYSVKMDVACIGFLVPVEGSENLFVMGALDTLYLVKWNGFSPEVESMSPLHKLQDEPATNRINDGKCDPYGRLWFGTMKLEDYLNGRVAAFYSYTRSGGEVKHLTEVGISNGLAFDLSKGVLYYIDTLNQAVEQFNYSSFGQIGQRRTAFDFKKYKFPFFPDGMTIDSDGKLWVACYAGSRVIRVDPDNGELLEQITIPTANVTSVCWGGPGLTDLYVTTNNLDNDGTDTNGGCVFRVTGLTARGVQAHHFKL